MLDVMVERWQVTLCAALSLAGKAVALNNGLLVPPMGWSSWYGFQANINEGMIQEMADAMVSSGLRAAG
jgi:alpha-galactosidase